MEKRVLIIVLAAACLMVFASAAFAEHPITPTSLTGVNVVDDEWVKANKDKCVVLDVRKKAEYMEGHVAGAVYLPYEEKSEKVEKFDASLDSFDTSAVKADKATGCVVTYCNGERCWKSYKAAVALTKAGFKKVNWYRDSGFPGWKAKGFPVE